MSAVVALSARILAMGPWLVVLASLAAGSATAAPGDADAPEPGLEARLDRALAVPALAGARRSVLVVTRDGGRVLYARDPDRALVPASNQKLLTALAALAELGPGHRFETGLLASEPLAVDGSVGTLYVRGGGDPALTSEDWWRLAADLRMAGLRRVRGDLVVDDTLFDDVRWHPSWGDVSARAYHAPVGALSANYGAFRITVAPGEPGGPAAVRLDPPVPHLELRARVATRRGGRSAVEIRRIPLADHERVVVTGAVPAGAEPEDYWRSVGDPVRYAAAVLRLQLAANGIPVEGETRAARVPPTATPLLVFEGRPLGEIVRLFVKYSNNAIAESLLKSLARPTPETPATFPAGAAALRARLAALGLPLDGARLVDGSGLSRDNRVSARLLVAALDTAHRSFEVGPELLAALPIAAMDGTLAERAAGAAVRVRAKTGLLTGVTGLSGWARDAQGRDLLFSVLVNGYAQGDRAAMDALDGFLAALVR